MADELTATIPDAEMEKLEALAVQHDTEAAQEMSAQEPEIAQPEAAEPKPEAEAKPDNSEIAPEKVKDRPRDELGRFTKTESGEDIPEAERKPVEEVKPDSEYEKAKKERARQDGLLRNFQKEKEQFRHEAENERQRIAQERAKLERDAQSRQQRKYVSTDVFDAAEDAQNAAIKALQDGDYDEHGKQLGSAIQLRKEAVKLYEAEQADSALRAEEQFREFYKNVTLSEMEKDPELKKEGPLSNEVLRLLATRDPRLMTPVGKNIFEVLPHGFSLAKDLAKLTLQSGSVSELQEKLKQAEAKIQQFTKATTPLGAGPTNPVQPQKFDSLSADEQMKELERMAARVDAEAFA